MKILRILRRRKIKLSFIFLLLLVFIVNTYAWMRTDRKTAMGTITLNVDDWSVAFIIEDEEVTTEEYTFDIEEFYPGIATEDNPIVKQIDVYNTGEANSLLKYEITEIYLYGEQIYNIEETENGETFYVPETLGEKTETDGITTADLFGNEDAIIFKNDEERTTEEKENTNYTFSLRYPTPFTITYSYEDTRIAGKDESESATSWFKINLAWENDDENNNEEDTKIGNMVYNFENAKDAEGNLINEGEPALKIVTRVTATRELK